MFELAGVQHTLPAALVSLTVSSNVLTMAFKSNTLQQLSLTNSDAIANLVLGKKGDYTIYKIFSDPTGKHVLIATHQGENFYLYEGWQKAQHLARCKLIIESVAWNSQASSPSTSYPRTSTREILLGGRNGTIYEMLVDAHTDVFKPYDRYVSPIYHLPDRQPITGLHAEFLTTGNRVFVLATSSSRIYQFVGMVDRRPDEVGKLYDSVFMPYRDAAPSKSSISNTVFYANDALYTEFLELSGPAQHSELHVSTTSKTTRTIAWLTGRVSSGISWFPNLAEDLKFISARNISRNSEPRGNRFRHHRFSLPPPLSVPKIFDIPRLFTKSISRFDTVVNPHY